MSGCQGAHRGVRYRLGPTMIDEDELKAEDDWRGMPPPADGLHTPPAWPPSRSGPADPLDATLAGRDEPPRSVDEGSSTVVDIPDGLTVFGGHQPHSGTTAD